MQPSSSINSEAFVNKPCLITFKSDIIYEGKTTGWRQDGFLIEAWLREGILLKGNVFVTWNNIGSIVPLEDVLKAQTEKEEVL